MKAVIWPFTGIDGMMEDCSGTVVTLTNVSSFWLDFVDGQFTLGETRFSAFDGKEQRFWGEDDALDANPDVKEAKRRLRLRRPTEPARPDHQGRM